MSTIQGSGQIPAALRSVECFGPVTPTADTSILASGDVAFNPVELPGFFSGYGAVRLLTGVQVVDRDDQGIALDLVLMNASTNLGTLNSAPNISDDNITSAVLATVSLVAGDYVDLGGARVATKILSLPIPLVGPAASLSVWIGGISRGTPTYTAAGLRIKLFAA